MIWVRSIAGLEGFKARLVFNDGKERMVDLEPLLHGPVFEPVRQSPELFRAVQVDEELGTIVWPNGADIDPDVLYGSYKPAWMEEENAAA